MVSTLSFLQCFDTVGCVTARSSGPLIPVPLLFWNRWSENTEGELTEVHWKTAFKTKVMVDVVKLCKMSALFDEADIPCPAVFTK